MTDTETPRRHREAPELGHAAARMMRGLVRRAQDGDTEALEQLAMLQQLASQCTQMAGYELKQRQRYTYNALAGELGITRQAAYQRFNREPNLLLQAWVAGDAAIDTVTHAVATQERIAKALTA